MKGIPDIFIHREHQREFDAKGFIQVPFLLPEEVKYLDKLFDELHPDLPTSGFISGSYSGDYTYKKRASEEILKIFLPHFNRLFKDFTAMGGAFLFKMPSEDSALVLHQDWTIVDETKAIAINCWVPLCDTDIHNGTLMVLPGAHNGHFPVHRAPTLHFFFTGHEELVMKHLVPTNARAGEAVILNQSLVHYSPPNRSGKIRKAITAGVKTKDAPMQFFYKNPQAPPDTLELYEMDEDFLIKFENFAQDIYTTPKHGRLIGTISYRLPQPSATDLQKLIDHFLTKSGHKKRGLISRLKNLFHHADT